MCLAPVQATGEAERWMAEMASELEAAERKVSRDESDDQVVAAIDWTLLRDRDRYLADIAACMEAIRGGQSYELCLTNQLRASVRVDSLRLHRVLRRSSPAPYAALLRLPGLDIVSSFSPSASSPWTASGA